MDTNNTKKSKKPLIIQSAGITDIGCVRKRNEDAFLVVPAQGLFIVADGMGGHASGEIAASLVVERLPGILAERLDGLNSVKTEIALSVRKILIECFGKLNRLIYEEGISNLEQSGMGTTAVALWLSGRRAYIVNIGDSRAYILRDSELRQLTVDHSVVNLLLLHGEITPEEAKNHPARGHLTRFLGMEEGIDADVKTVIIKQKDRLLLCSDGLWGRLSHQEIGEILTEHRDPAAACSALVAAGNLAGGQDNITAVVVDLLGGLA